MRQRRKGQVSVEAALLFVVVIAAVIAMVLYLRRNVMGGLRSSGTQIGEQFSPLSTVNSYTRTVAGNSTEKSFANGQTDNQQDTTQDRTGSESVETLGSDTLF